MANRIPFHSVKVADIIVGDRFRKVYEGIDELAQSIAAQGMLQPLVVNEVNGTIQLCAGGRRLEAIKKLDWATVNVHYFNDLSEIERREIELQENLHRKDLSVVEEARLTREIQRLLELKEGATIEEVTAPGITKPSAGAASAVSTRAIAEIQGISHMTVARNLRIANAVEIMPSLEAETSQANILRKIDRMVSDLERALDLRSRKREVEQLTADYIKQGDSTSLILSLDTHSVDCVIMDPPYGTGNLDGNIYKYRHAKDYDDSPEATLAILRSIIPELRRVLKPDGHLWAFFGPPLWQQTLDMWRQGGFDISAIIGIWYKTGGATGNTNWDFDLAPDWEPFLLSHNRQRKLSRKHGATFSYPPDLGSNRVHPNQKPLPLIKEFLSLSTLPGDIVLDPFCGSGTTPVACREMGRKFIAWDLDERNVQITKERLINAKAPTSQMSVADRPTLQGGSMVSDAGAAVSPTRASVEQEDF